MHAPGESGGMALWYIADHITDDSRIGAFAAHQTLPVRPRQNAEQAAQKRRLADSVAPQNGKDFTRCEREG